MSTTINRIKMPTEGPEIRDIPEETHFKKTKSPEKSLFQQHWRVSLAVAAVSVAIATVFSFSSELARVKRELAATKAALAAEKAKTANAHQRVLTTQEQAMLVLGLKKLEGDAAKERHTKREDALDNIALAMHEMRSPYHGTPEQSELERLVELADIAIGDRNSAAFHKITQKIEEKFPKTADYVKEIRSEAKFIFGPELVPQLPEALPGTLPNLLPDELPAGLLNGPIEGPPQWKLNPRPINSHL